MEEDEVEEENREPLKRALVLGAEATRRRKREADEPEGVGVLACEEGIRKVVWVGPAVTGGALP